jgi:magnesium transporter
MSDNTRTYLRDVYDHLVQIIDIIETYREIAASMTETYATSMGNRLNEVMKVLTVVTTIFVPLSFLSSVWGMNFARMPEMQWAHAYPWSYPLGFWGLCACIAGGLVYWFRKRGWL